MASALCEIDGSGARGFASVLQEMAQRHLQAKGNRGAKAGERMDDISATCIQQGTREGYEPQQGMGGI